MNVIQTQRYAVPSTKYENWYDVPCLLERTWCLLDVWYIAIFNCLEIRILSMIFAHALPEFFSYLWFWSMVNFMSHGKYTNLSNIQYRNLIISVPKKHTHVKFYFDTAVRWLEKRCHIFPWNFVISFLLYVNQTVPILMQIESNLDMLRYTYIYTQFSVSIFQKIFFKLISQYFLGSIMN